MDAWNPYFTPDRFEDESVEQQFFVGPGKGITLAPYSHKFFGKQKWISWMVSFGEKASH